MARQFSQGATFYPSFQESNTDITTVTLEIIRLDDGFYLDFNDLTFKSSGWTTKQQSLTESSGVWIWTTGWVTPNVNKDYLPIYEDNLAYRYSGELIQVGTTRVSADATAVTVSSAAQLTVCNKALIELGEAKVTAIPGNDFAGKLCDDLWGLVLKEVLEAAKWDFAKKWVSPTLNSNAITGATQASPCVLTVVAHPFVVGQRVTINDVSGMTDLNGNTYLISAIATDTITLQSLAGVDLNATAFGAYTSGGTAKFGLIDDEYTYVYNLPSDYIRMSRMYNVDDQFEVRAQWLMSNTQFLKFEYIFEDTTVANYPNHFIIALVARLKASLAQPLAKKGFKEFTVLMDEYRKVLPYSQTKDGEQGSPSEKHQKRHTNETETWLTVRN